MYARMNEKAQEVLMHLEAYKPFMEFVKSWERHSEVSSAGGLRSYLILPIQRIPRYELFLKVDTFLVGVGKFLKLCKDMLSIPPPPPLIVA